MRKIKVLQITPSLHIGGLEMVIANMCRHISFKDNVDLSVCCIKELGSIGQDLVRQGFSITVLNKPKYLKNNYISWYQILSIVKNNNIEVLHSHTMDSLLDATLCKLFNKQIKTVHTFHYGNYPNIPRKYMYIEMICARYCDQLVAVGNEQRKKIVKALNISDDIIHTIWNGVPKSTINHYSSVIDNYRHDGTVIIGTVCTLIEQKGLFDLITVADLLKKQNIHAKFIIAGEGHLRDELEKEVKTLGLTDNVVFIGWVENAAHTFIPFIDIFYLPSLWEAMSVVVLEAMEAGKPVVTTNVGENEHVIKNGISGFVLESRNIEGMAEILKRLVNDENMRYITGQKAKDSAHKSYGVNNMVSEYLKIYKNVIER